MGNKLAKRRSAVDEALTRPQGLYEHQDIDLKKLRRLIIDGRLAPCYVGLEEGGQELEECPICFMNYPSLNRSRCCRKGVCTECFLQMKSPTSMHPTTCPFCKASSYAVQYTGTLSQEERLEEYEEEQKVAEAKLRMIKEEQAAYEARLAQRSTATSAVSSHPAHPTSSPSVVSDTAATAATTAAHSSPVTTVDGWAGAAGSDSQSETRSATMSAPPLAELTESEAELPASASSMGEGQRPHAGSQLSAPAPRQSSEEGPAAARDSAASAGLTPSQATAGDAAAHPPSVTAEEAATGAAAAPGQESEPEPGQRAGEAGAPGVFSRPANPWTALFSVALGARRNGPFSGELPPGASPAAASGAAAAAGGAGAGSSTGTATAEQAAGGRALLPTLSLPSPGSTTGRLANAAGARDSVSTGGSPLLHPPAAVASAASGAAPGNAPASQAAASSAPIPVAPAPTSAASSSHGSKGKAKRSAGGAWWNLTEAARAVSPNQLLLHSSGSSAREVAASVRERQRERERESAALEVLLGEVLDESDEAIAARLWPLVDRLGTRALARMDAGSAGAGGGGSGLPAGSRAELRQALFNGAFSGHLDDLEGPPFAERGPFVWGDLRGEERRDGDRHGSGRAGASEGSTPGRGASRAAAAEGSNAGSFLAFSPRPPAQHGQAGAQGGLQGGHQQPQQPLQHYVPGSFYEALHGHPGRYGLGAGADSSGSSSSAAASRAIASRLARQALLSYSHAQSAAAAAAAGAGAGASGLPADSPSASAPMAAQGTSGSPAAAPHRGHLGGGLGAREPLRYTRATMVDSSAARRLARGLQADGEFRPVGSHLLEGLEGGAAQAGGSSALAAFSPATGGSSSSRSAGVEGERNADGGDVGDSGNSSTASFTQWNTTASPRRSAHAVTSELEELMVMQAILLSLQEERERRQVRMQPLQGHSSAPSQVQATVPPPLQNSSTTPSGGPTVAQEADDEAEEEGRIPDDFESQMRLAMALSLAEQQQGQ